MVTIYVRWQVPQGWTYAAYTTGETPGESHRTLLPTAMELVSKVVEGFPDGDREAMESHKEKVTAALTERYPKCRVEFVAMPSSAH